MSLRRVLLLGLAVAAASLSVAPRSASAHIGPLDQTLQNDPGCSSTVFRATAPFANTRQEFVPALAGLSAVDLCLETGAAGNVTLKVRSGTAASPGAELGNVTLSYGFGSGSHYVHFDLTPPLPTLVGTTYVLEETSGFPSYTWRGTCGSVQLPSCPTADLDLYPAGVSNAAAPVGNLAFRTYSAPPVGGVSKMVEPALLDAASADDAADAGSNTTIDGTAGIVVAAVSSLAIALYMRRRLSS